MTVYTACTVCGATASFGRDVIHYGNCEYVKSQEKRWHADSNRDMVRIFRGNYQVAKMPKHGTDYAEYWPGKKTLQWMLNAMNEYEKTHPLEHSVNE